MEKLKMAILDKIENLDVTTLSLDELEKLCYIIYIIKMWNITEVNLDTDVLNELIEEEEKEEKEDVTNI